MYIFWKANAGVCDLEKSNILALDSFMAFILVNQVHSEVTRFISRSTHRFDSVSLCERAIPPFRTAPNRSRHILVFGLRPLTTYCRYSPILPGNSQGIYIGHGVIDVGSSKKQWEGRGIAFSLGTALFLNAKRKWSLVRMLGLSKATRLIFDKEGPMLYCNA
eukprot:1343018-Amorphochlora_amoeboformis.AAC.1